MEEQIEKFLRRNFPQIQMHGGSSSILEADKETGTVVIELSGACSGCGISPMTVTAIKKRLFNEMPEVQEITVYAGQESMGTPTKQQTGDSEREFDAPF